jgi:hypothetical protein
MGLGQSTAGPKDTNKKDKNALPLDLGTGGDQPKPAKKPKKKKKANRKGADSNQGEKMAEASQQEQQQPTHGLTGLAPLATLAEMPSSPPQLATLNTMTRPETRSSQTDSLSLQELDAILDRMRAKYRPNPVSLMGQSRGFFEEFEQNLANCFSKHKDRPLDCSKLAREYTAFVNEQRNRILRDATTKNPPVFT